MGTWKITSVCDGNVRSNCLSGTWMLPMGTNGLQIGNDAVGIFKRGQKGCADIDGTDGVENGLRGKHGCRIRCQALFADNGVSVCRGDVAKQADGNAL